MMELSSMDERRIATHPENLVAVLERFNLDAPDHDLYTFLDENGEGRSIQVGQLREHALAAAAYLEKSGAQSGKLLLITVEHGYAQAVMFWGALYLGAHPSILAYFPPEIASGAYQEQLEKLARFTRAPAIVCEHDYVKVLTQGRSLEARLIPKPDVSRLYPPSDFQPYQPSKGETAYIQFSSGTTGTPKGVILSHSALVEYLETAHGFMAISSGDVNIGWLPLFHDMGLCTQVLQPVYSRFPSVFLSAADWLRQPHILFDAISRHSGTITWMPNFAFKYCLRHVRDEHMPQADLSSWRILGCGSEPVQMEALQAFADRFAQYGFDRNALTVAYGLAEHIAGVTSTPLGTAPRVDWVSETSLHELLAVPVEPGSQGSRALSSCGLPKPNVDLRVVSEDGTALPERQVGEVLVRSPTLFKGYYRLPDETAAALKDGWLHTGDLGYLLDGELYICGRKKELIIVRGRNLLPHHLEEIAQKLLGKNLRYAVAFGIEDAKAGTELPVLVCEMRGSHDDQTKTKWRAALREATNQALHVYLEDIHFVAKGWIVKTTSGKINHGANRAKYLREIGERVRDFQAAVEDTIAEWTPKEQQLYRIWVELLKTGAVGLNDNFFQLGGDSLMAAQLLLEIESQFGLALPSSVFFERATIKAMAALIEHGDLDLHEKIVVPIQPVSDKNDLPIFFCVHALGGGVLGYRNLSEAMGREQPFYGLQAQIHEGDSPLDARVGKMAARYIDAMREIQPEGPYHIGGYCFGGVVAYEMAQQLSLDGEQVASLVVIDRHAPRKTSLMSALVDELRQDYDFFRRFPEELRKFLSLDGSQRRDRVNRIVRRLSKRLAQLFGVASKLSLEDVANPSNLSRSRRQIDAAIFEAYQRYRPKPYQGDLTLIRTPRGLLDPNKAMGWNKLVSGNVSVQTIPGSHESILKPPYVEALAERLKATLGSPH